ncbi:hypothetical protein EVAR_4939_1 [Eumeta japonica]|uniref:Mariner Mos1 transposase n=1 Tax=Eumeta variegata TaxID=151549 RepID=A0A4C1V0X8_EUMVA|nr:hypothetical protein EVAR_4939_1 [Eumeta japonica]
MKERDGEQNPPKPDSIVGIQVSSNSFQFHPVEFHLVPHFPSIRYPIPTQETGNVLGNSLGLQMSMGSDDHLYSGGSHDRLPLDNAPTVRLFQDEPTFNKLKRARSIAKALNELLLKLFLTSHLVTLATSKKALMLQHTIHGMLTKSLSEGLTAVSSKRQNTGINSILFHYDNASTHSPFKAKDFLESAPIKLIVEKLVCGYFTQINGTTTPGTCSRWRGSGARRSHMATIAVLLSSGTETREETGRTHVLQ